MLSSKCAVHDSEKPKFIKKQEINGSLSKLEIKTPLSKTPLLGDILFWRCKINETLNKVLLAEDRFMPEIHLRQRRFNYSACEPFTKTKGTMQKFKETGD